MGPHDICIYIYTYVYISYTFVCVYIYVYDFCIQGLTRDLNEGPILGTLEVFAQHGLWGLRDPTAQFKSAAPQRVGTPKFELL